MKYNLLEEAWLSVIYRNGKAARVTLFDALKQADKLQIAYPNPMDRFAVFRFILALLYWCKQETNKDLGNMIDPQWLSFLADHHDAFKLFGDGKRFMQQSGLSRLRPVTELIQDIPTGNNAWHFRHVRDYTAGICPHCCVPGILKLPLYYVSGLPSLKSGINGIPPIYVSLWSDNLFSSIAANWNPLEPLGDPNWVKEYKYGQDDAVPLLAGFTVPARKIYLNEPREGEGTCACCGEKSHHLLYTILFESAGSLENSCWVDPFVVYREKGSYKAANIIGTGKLIYDARYRSLLATYLANNSQPNHLQIFLHGFVTDNAKYVDVWERTIKLDSDLISKEVLNVLRQWDDSVKNTGLRTSGKDRLKKQKDSLTNDLIPDTEARLFKKIVDLFKTHDPDWEEASQLYNPMLRTASRVLHPGVGVKVLMRRNSINYSKPKVPKLPATTQEGGGQNVTSTN